MAMSLPISTPSAGNSPSSDDSSNHPLTPDSPGGATLPTPPQSADSNHVGQMKRKPSRRANTAERRATHNAVERQRRETLNGRFLDLAALLPNLSQIRRPSKSSIVNSSIAHIHASRRHRLLASRELRALKQESDSLRRELNEWRNRAGVPLVEEPVRGEGFTMVLSGEIEVLAAIADDEDEAGQDYDGYDEGNDEFAGGVPTHNGNSNMGLDDSDEQQQQRNQMAAAAAAASVAMIKNANANNPFAQNIPSMGHLLAARGPPMIASSPTSVSFENPAMASLYEPSTAPHHQQQFPFLHQLSQEASMDKWNQQPQQQMYSLQSQQQQQQQQQRNIFNAPPTAQLTPPPTSAAATFADPLFFANLQRQQQQLSSMGHMYGSPIEGDDTSSIGSVHSIGGGGGRQRRASSSNGSNGYLTPPHASPTGSFDLASVMGEVVGRRASSGNGSSLHINTGGWRNSADMDGMVGLNLMKQQQQQQPISVGGGGSGGFMSMMF